MYLALDVEEDSGEVAGDGDGVSRGDEREVLESADIRGLAGIDSSPERDLDAYRE